MQRETNYLERLGEIARIVHEGRNGQDVLERMAYAICFNSPWQSSSIMAVDVPNQEALEVAHFSRTQTELNRSSSWKLTTSPALRAVETNKPVIIRDALSDRDYIEYWSDAQVQRYRTVVVLPLRSTDDAGRPLAISIHAFEVTGVDEDMLSYLVTCADLAGMAVEKNRAFNAKKVANEKLSELLALQQSLVLQALRETSIGTLTDLCRRYLNCPVILVDFVLGEAWCGGFSDNERIARECNGQAWRALEQIFTSAKAGKFLNGVKQLDLPAEAGGSLDLVIQSVQVGGETIGGIALVGGSALSEPELQTGDAIWIVLSIVLLKNHIGHEAQTRDTSEFLTDLFEGRMTPQKLERISQASMLRACNRILAFRIASGTISLTAASRAISRQLLASDTRFLLCVVNQFLVVLVPENAADPEQPERIADRILAELGRMMRQVPVLVEIADCSQFTDYEGGWRRIQRLAEWAARNQRRGRISVGSAGVLGLLSEGFDYGMAGDFCDNLLGPLRAAEGGRQGVLQETLDLLVAHGGRPQPVADALGIHITTVRYRIQKLRDQFGIDIRDAETRFGIEMALRLSRMLPLSRPGL